jgi:UDP-N-acetyl-D-mannosaminuronate dehydrogenase
MSVYTTSDEDGFSLENLTVSVFGLNKMGLPLAAVLADHGASIIGVDIDSDIVDSIEAGRCSTEGCWRKINRVLRNRLFENLDK